MTTSRGLRVSTGAVLRRQEEASPEGSKSGDNRTPDQLRALQNKTGCRGFAESPRLFPVYATLPPALL